MYEVIHPSDNCDEDRISIFLKFFVISPREI